MLEGLRERGVDPTGCDGCRNQCDLSTPAEEAREGWWYAPSKNKWKLRKTAERRGMLRQGLVPDTTPTPRSAPSAKVRQRPLAPTSDK